MDCLVLKPICLALTSSNAFNSLIIMMMMMMMMMIIITGDMKF